jgi:hypothetical protein
MQEHRIPKMAYIYEYGNKDKSKHLNCKTGFKVFNTFTARRRKLADKRKYYFI